MLDLSSIGLTGVPVFGRYEYYSARPGLRTHAHPDAIEISYLERGCQTYRTGGREYHLVGGDFFVTAPGEPHDTGGQVEDRGVLYWMILNIPKRSQSILMLPPKESMLLVNEISTLPHRHFPGNAALKQELDEIFGFYEQLQQGSQFPSAADELTAVRLIRIAVANQLVRFLLEMIGCARRHQGAHHSSVISRLVERIKASPEQNYSLVELAAEAKLSLSRFKRKFKAEIGIAPHDYILRCKIEAAKRMLCERGMSVTDTAMELGFSSSQYFATVFRKFTRQTPVEFSSQRSAVPLRSASHAVETTCRTTTSDFALHE